MKKRLKQNAYLLIWCAAAGVAVWLFLHWHVATDYVGIVERRIHLAGAREPGILDTLLVDLEDHVESGQILARLDISDLKTQEKQLDEQLTAEKALEQAHRKRYLLEYQRMRMDLVNESSDAAERQAVLEAKTAELAGLNTEIQRLQNADAAGLGCARDLADLQLRRDTLYTFLKEQRPEHRCAVVTGLTDSLPPTHDTEAIISSLLSESKERIHELQQAISAIESRIRYRTIVSPCEGYIVNLMAYPGDAVEAFMPVLEIEESRADFLQMYLPEQADFSIEPGMTAQVYSTRSRIHNTTGTVSFINPGFSRAPQRLEIRGQEFWARVIRIDLDDHHTLIPGEAVHVRLEQGGSDSPGMFQTARAAGDSAHLAENPAHGQPVPVEISVPESLGAVTRLEPSGMVWLNKLQRYLVVSDDTGHPGQKTDHAPWLFQMDAHGIMDPEPVILGGVSSLNDLESATVSNDGTVYLVSSQNISKKGKRPRNREQILAVETSGGIYTVRHNVNFLALLEKSYSSEQLLDLGLGAVAEDGRPVLNIEGAAWLDGTLLLGLKEPVSPRGALIWQLKNPPAMLTDKHLTPGQLTVYGYVALDPDAPQSAGIADLAVDSHGRLWALSTLPHAGSTGQLGRLCRIDRFNDKRLKARTVFTFPGQKPEALSFPDPDHIMILFDCDAATPRFLSCKVADL